MIRNATLADLPAITRLFDGARIFMRQSGNPSQWPEGYPSQDTILLDIGNSNFYVEDNDGAVTGCFAFIIGEEPTYGEINGEWPGEAPYGTIHRLVSDGSQKGFSDRCIAFCRNRIATLRADTHRDNLPMQRSLLRNGFRYCGIIRVADGSERLAYQLG